MCEGLQNPSFAGIGCWVYQLLEAKLQGPDKPLPKKFRRHRINFPLLEMLRLLKARVMAVGVEIALKGSSFAATFRLDVGWTSRAQPNLADR